MTFIVDDNQIRCGKFTAQSSPKSFVDKYAATYSSTPARRSARSSAVIRIAGVHSMAQLVGGVKRKAVCGRHREARTKRSSIHCAQAREPVPGLLNGLTQSSEPLSIVLRWPRARVFGGQIPLAAVLQAALVLQGDCFKGLTTCQCGPPEISGLFDDIDVMLTVSPSFSVVKRRVCSHTVQQQNVRRG